MRKTILALACTAGLGLQAQNVYEIERHSTNDLNGTARFVGMGGAMNALGADLSTMTGNPAAIGMYRSSDFALTASVQAQKGAEKFGDQNKVRGSFDQAGLVYAFKTYNESLRYFCFGFNYQKMHNLKQFIGSDGWLQLDNDATMLGQLGSQLYGAAVGFKDDGKWRDYNSVVSNGAYSAGFLDFKKDADGKITDVLVPAKTESYNYRRANWGHVNSYNINLSFNVRDRFYFGLTTSIYDVYSRSLLYHQEILQSTPNYSYGLEEETRLYGTGFDMKFGMIVRPVEESPFRFGLAFHTPRILSLTQQKWAQYDSKSPIYTDSPKFDLLSTGAYDYNIRTPWRLQLSAATTVSNWLALDAEYELAMYNKTAIKYPYYDRFDRPSWVDGNKDLFIDDEVDYCLRPQHTLRIGMEGRFAEQFYGRIGYNFVSSPFKKDAYLNLAPAQTSEDYTTVPNSTYEATSTDYINLGNTNRLSLGLGWHGKTAYADVAYVCQNQSAEAHAFHDDNLTPIKKDIVRHSVLFTFGVKF